MTQKRDKLGHFLPNPASQWYLDYKPDGSKYRVGYFDIESSGFKADNWVSCWTIKERNGGYITRSITKDEVFNWKFDKRLVREFVEAANEFDLLVGYFSSGFDIPMLRSRNFKWKQPFIKRQEINHLDLYFNVRGKVNTYRKSLDAVCSLIGFPDKIHIPLETFYLAALGQPKALKQVIKRNQVDCDILEKCHRYFEPYIKFNRNWI